MPLKLGCNTHKLSILGKRIQLLGDHITPSMPMHRVTAPRSIKGDGDLQDIYYVCILLLTFRMCWVINTPIYWRYIPRFHLGSLYGWGRYPRHP